MTSKRSFSSKLFYDSMNLQLRQPTMNQSNGSVVPFVITSVGPKGPWTQISVGKNREFLSWILSVWAQETTWCWLSLHEGLGSCSPGFPSSFQIRATGISQILTSFLCNSHHKYWLQQHFSGAVPGARAWSSLVKLYSCTVRVGDRTAHFT